MIRAVAYCRVSTSKEEQLDSLETQQQFFSDYARKNGYHLIHIYADEGKSGTKMKNRTQLLRMLSDAVQQQYDVVLIKDVSRLARNTLDFLTSIRKLKSFGIKVLFVNYDQTTSESSEFMLTLLSAMAQEESANTSKRIKFGKKLNAERGKVPNLVFGYDKIPGEYFTLHINEKESQIVRQIFYWYARESLGTNRIASELNHRGIPTKRGSRWSQNTVARILSNPLYIGKVINGKQEVADFLTSRRADRPPEDWSVVSRPELALVEEDLFDQAQRILQQNKELFHSTGQRQSQRHVFSKLIRCGCCGSSFRRVERRSRKGTVVYWTCAGRNANGVDYCPNQTKIEEKKLLVSLQEYFSSLLDDRPSVIKRIAAECNRQLQSRGETLLTEKDLRSSLSKASRSKQRYLEMYENEIIDMDTLKSKTQELNETIRRLQEQLLFIRQRTYQEDSFSSLWNDIFQDPDGILSIETITHDLLSPLVKQMEVDRYGHIDVYLRPLSEAPLISGVPITDNRT